LSWYDRSTLSVEASWEGGSGDREGDGNAVSVPGLIGFRKKGIFFIGRSRGKFGRPVKKALPLRECVSARPRTANLECFLKTEKWNSSI